MRAHDNLMHAPPGDTEPPMPADLADRADFGNANRGLTARREPGVVKADGGRVVAIVRRRTLA